MPRRRVAEMSPEERAARRTRVTPYQIRIERTLTSFYTEVPAQRNAGREWHLVAVAHTNGHATCQLCGHNPIRRLFFIQRVETGQELMIGSECARNYVGVDLVDAYMRRIVRHQTNARRQAEYLEYRRRAEERRAAREAAEAQDHSELTEALGTTPEPAAVPTDSRRTEAEAFEHYEAAVVHLRNTDNTSGSPFLTSVAGYLERNGFITLRQAERVWQVMNSGGPHGTPPVAAGAEDASTIHNGVYTISISGEHLSYRIHTVQQGTLAGKRIIKRKTGPAWEGFAFLNENGTLGLWRRFQQYEQALFVQRARTLLTAIQQHNEENASAALRTSDPVLEYYTQVDGLMYRVNATRLCRRCNRDLTTPTSVAEGLGPECSSRVRENTRAAQAEATLTTAGIGRRAPRSPRTTATQGELELSELGTGEIR